MAEVKWTARRVSDGVLVDVTGDIEGTPVIAPTANALEGGGGEQRVRLLGPFAVAYNTAGISAGFITIATIPANAVVFATWMIITAAWNGVDPYVEIGFAEGGDLPNSEVISAWDLGGTPPVRISAVPSNSSLITYGPWRVTIPSDGAHVVTAR